jgi:hypothetical protein
MGRPINEKFFGENTYPYADVSHTKSGVGGEGIATVSIPVGGEGINYSQGTTLIITAPQITNGQTPFLTPTINSAGTLTNITVTSAGSGYTSTSGVQVTVVKPATQTATAVTGTSGASTIQVTGVNGVYVGMGVTGNNVGSGAKVVSISGTTVTVSVANTQGVNGTITFTDNGSGITNTTTNITLTTGKGSSVINFTAFIPTANGGSSAIGNGDILKQEGSKQYLVVNAQGRGRVKLVATATASLVAGQMNVQATDFNGSTYWVSNLQGRKARVKRYQSAGGGYLVADGVKTKWVVSGAITGTTVTIAHYN